LLALLFLSLAIVPMPAFAARGIASGHAPRILAILSYDPSFPTSADILAGLGDSFPADAYDVRIHYMNTKRLPGAEHTAMFQSLFAWELTHSPPPDLVMTFDDNALRFVMDNRASLFNGIPVVFAGVNDRRFAQSVEKQKDITGVFEAVSIGETVEMMRRLFPHHPSLGVIVDSTESGRADLRTLQTLDLHIPLSVYDLSARTEADFLAALRRIPASQPVLLLSAYSGYAGRIYSFPESLALIRQTCSAPVFHLWKHGVGQGLLGGKLVSQYEQAMSSAGLAKRVLAGARCADLPIIWESPNVYLFDWNELRRFDIKLDAVPAESRILNRPLSLRESHPEVFWGIMVAGVAAAGLITALFLVLHYRKKAARRLVQSLDFMNRLIQAIETPIYLKNPQAEYLMVNSSFARLAKREPDWLVGRKGHEIIDRETALILDDLGQRALRDKTPVSTEVDLVFDGERRIFRVSKVALINPEGMTIILGSMQDITADRLLAERLKTENQRLESMVAERTIQLERANAVLATLAETDRLTKLANRRKIDSVLAEEFILAQRYQSFSLIMLDIDHFKAINDQFGHPVGDDVLQKLAALLRSQCRATDLIGRWGGEEFLIISRNTPLPGALDLARKLRQQVEQAAILPAQPVTASFGVTSLCPDDTVGTVLQRVDSLLYQAKQRGRNRVEWELSAEPAAP
jgi:diguanylate cyclase (GGDEF)-like protein